MTLTVFSVLCLACSRWWVRVGHRPLTCPFCGSNDYHAVRA